MQSLKPGSNLSTVKNFHQESVFLNRHWVNALTGAGVSDVMCAIRMKKRKKFGLKAIFVLGGNVSIRSCSNYGNAEAIRRGGGVVWRGAETTGAIRVRSGFWGEASALKFMNAHVVIRSFEIIIITLYA